MLKDTIIIGPQGSGKTTLLNTLLRGYDKIYRQTSANITCRDLFNHPSIGLDDCQAIVIEDVPNVSLVAAMQSYHKQILSARSPNNLVNYVFKRPPLYITTQATIEELPVGISWLINTGAIDCWRTNKS